MTTKAAVAVLPKKLFERSHGKDIFAYSNIQTNQVIYSLERSMKNNPSLKQLPYAGKNTVPGSLRKDYWRPFYSVSFPSNQQGLAAFRRLREWKTMHEVSWDRTDLPELEFSEDQKKKREQKKEELGDNLPRKGGARPSRLTDMDKRKRKIIMDQRANSVADLAAVLIEHDEIGAKLSSKQPTKALRDEEEIVANMKALVKEEQEGGRQKLDRSIEKLEKLINSTSDAEADSKTARQQGSLKQLQRKRSQMLTVAKIAEKAREEPLRLHERELAKLARIRTGSRAAEAPSDPPAPEIDLSEIFREKLPSLTVFQEAKGELSPGQPLPKRGGRRNAMRQLLNPTPVYSTAGVKVRWANLLDAEYAEAWPRNVQHDILGLLRHTASRPGEDPVVELVDRMWDPETGRRVTDEELAGPGSRELEAEPEVYQQIRPETIAGASQGAGQSARV